MYKLRSLFPIPGTGLKLLRDGRTLGTIGAVMGTKINLRLVFGTELRNCRNHKAISQEGLAKLTGLHVHMIYLLEHGERNPSLDTIQKLAKALDVKPGKFFRKF
jgi:DNA-binding XRE family transcriptional regulator